MTKKILMGLAALSLLSMTSFAATGPDATTGKSSIQVTTTLAVLGGGIIITPNPDGTVNEDIYLNHGSFQAALNDVSKVTKDVYIRQASGADEAAALPAGFVINVGLAGDNKLMNGSNEILHTLTATVGTGAKPQVGTDKVVTISGGETEADKDFVTETTAKAIPVTVASEVAAGAISDATAVGPYQNVSTLTVSFAKTQ